MTAGWGAPMMRIDCDSNKIEILQNDLVRWDIWKVYVL